MWLYSGGGEVIFVRDWDCSLIGSGAVTVLEIVVVDSFDLKDLKDSSGI